MSVHACILGATGYGGGELLRLLGQHPEVTRIDGITRSRGGEPFHAVHPNLRGIVDGEFTDAPDWAALAAAERPVLFAALPHGEFAQRWPAMHELAPAGLTDKLVVIDLSGDFRLADADTYRRHYGIAHPCPEWLGRFTYGFPELQFAPQRRRPHEHAPKLGGNHVGAASMHVGAPPMRRDSICIANPGCFATALQLALLPLANLPDPGFIAVTGVTGSSGSGAQPSDTTHHPARAHDFRAYKLGGHQHLGEVERMFELAGAGSRTVSFVPHSAPLVRGIFVTAQFKLPEGVDADALLAAYVDTYKDAPFVRLVDGSPRIAAVIGSNFCDIGIQVNGQTAIVMAALDNLVKGMAGLAVQNMNLALGFDETAGLMQAALFPG
jgi:N-acetyl-gamma-glutamyl-phosphate reductase